MMKLNLQLLGEPRIFISETTEVYLATKKSQALVVYLASPPGIAHSRDHLATLLWGRSAKEQARSSLRQDLSKLRNSLGACKNAIDVWPTIDWLQSAIER
jgi:DNA-binding SARP family transcriptional activator